MGKTLMIIIFPVRLDKLQTCPLEILYYSFSANPPSKQQGGRYIVIGAMGSVGRVITLGGCGVVGNHRPRAYMHRPKELEAHTHTHMSHI